jgi:hypothetical protein
MTAAAEKHMLWLTVVSLSVLFLLWIVHQDGRRIDRLERTVSCLQQPTHAISAIPPGPIGKPARPVEVVWCP